MKAAILQLNATDDPAKNLEVTRGYLRDAVDQRARFVLTPEVTNCVSSSRAHQATVLTPEGDDPTLAALCDDAQRYGIWLLIGSLGLKTNDPDGRFANRSFLISPQGKIVARYDKIHMFDVDVTPEETYRESDGYRPGSKAVVAETPFAKIGMSICYDMRFPDLYQSLATAGADILTMPAAFSPVTGAVHWHSLLRARAIETGCFVLAPAQTGEHHASKGKQRSTFGHSLVVSPWGEIILDAGKAAGVYCFDLEMSQVAEARRRVPSQQNKRPFDDP